MTGLLALITTILIVILYYLGGEKKNAYRDIGVPILISLYYIIITHNIWLLSLMLSFSVIRLGYGNYEEGEQNCLLANLWAMIGIKDGAVVRASWGVLVALVGALPLLLTGYLKPLYYALYIVLNGFTGYIVSKGRLEVFFTDLLCSLSIATILL